MSKSTEVKSKQVPWIPPGKTSTRRSQLRNVRSVSHREEIKSPSKSKIVEPSENPVNQETIADVTINEAPKDIILDLSSISELSDNGNDELNICILSIQQERDILLSHFETLKSIVFSIYRLLNAEQDSFAKKLIFEVEEFVGELNNMFDELEFLISVYENTLNEESKVKEALKVSKCHEKLLRKLLKMYETVIFVFQTVFNNENLKKIAEIEGFWKSKLKLVEDKCLTKEAVITDLHRKLSINESKLSTSESYRKTLEETKNDLLKQLAQKESQIKYLNNELLETVSEMHNKSDHEALIDVIEELKYKTNDDIRALKKTLKFQKSQAAKVEDKFKKLNEDLKEKEQMLLELAAQRDQLKIHLTVVSNNVIDLKYQIEKLKKEKANLECELDEQNSKQKKEIMKLNDELNEKNSLWEKSLKEKKSLEETISDYKIKMKDLTEEKSVAREKIPKENQEDTANILGEIQSLGRLLQATKEEIQGLKSHSHIVTAGGDNILGDSIPYINIIKTVKEANEHLLELKDLFQKHLLVDSKRSITNSKKSELEKKLKEIEELYEKSVEENKLLKSRLEDIDNSSVSNSVIQKPENVTVNMPSDVYARKLQMELLKKSDEIVKLKYKYQEREKDLEDRLKESKDQIKSLEANNLKILNLEKDLHSKEIEFAMLRQQKSEESERFLQRIKELQDALDIKVTENESLLRYTQLLKSSYFNVFGAS